MKKVIFMVFLCFLFVVGSANASIVYNCYFPEQNNVAVLGPFTFDITIAGDLTTPGTVTVSTTSLGTSDPLNTWGWPEELIGEGTMTGSVLSVPGEVAYQVLFAGDTYDASLRNFEFDTATNAGTLVLSPTFTDVTWNYTATQAPAVPIPGAVLLFGSGLLGLVGIKRKVKK